MKGLLIAAVGVALAGCQNTATDEMLIAKAKETAGMPDCNSMRVAFAYQQESKGVYLLDAQFAASHSCMEKWGEQLADSGRFESGMEGGFSPKQATGSEVVVIGYPKRTRGGVVWRSNKPFAGIELDKGPGDD